MINRQTEVGEIVSVNGNVISVQLADNLKSNMPVIEGVVYRVGQIGSFLKIPLGYANLYGVVTTIGAAAIPKNFNELLKEEYDKLGNKQWLNMVLVGEQIGDKFDRGVSQSPTTGDKVHLVTINDLSIVYGGFGENNSITVGNISVSESLNAKLDLNKLISRHCAIIGSTGSGKSNLTVVLLNSIANKGFKSSRILVVDPHGEYNSALKDKSNVYKINANPSEDEKELCIPFWALPFNELMSIFSGNLTDSNKDYVRSEIADSKADSIEINTLKVDKGIITADSPIPFSLNQLWFNLDDIERKTFKKDKTTECLIEEGDPESLISSIYEPASPGSAEPLMNKNRKGILGFLDSVRVKLKDSRYKFLFEPGPYTPNLDGKVDKDLSDLLFEWLGSDEPVTILDLSGVPSEIMNSISGTLLKIVYDALFWGQNISIGGKEQPLMIVLEEAHNYLKAGENSISSKTVQTIAKEGRKYGVGLVMVTQRPSELDETVLSQCGTIIALRMNNSKDRSHVKSAIQDELQTIIDLLPSLRTGEGIISGEAVKIPSRVKFHKAENTPKSSDPSASELWEIGKTNIEDDYKKLLNLWRNQKLKEEMNDT